MEHHFGKHWPEMLPWYTAFWKLWQISILTLQMEEKLVHLANRPEESKMWAPVVSTYKALATPTGSTTQLFPLVTIVDQLNIEKQLQHNCIWFCFGCRTYDVFFRLIFPLFLLYKCKMTWNLNIYLLWTKCLCCPNVIVCMLKPSPPNMTIFGEGACEEVMWVEWSHNGGALLQQG